jgi:hypothetical protein
MKEQSREDYNLPEECELTIQVNARTLDAGKVKVNGLAV